MGTNDCPVRLRHLQFGGEAPRPLGLFGVILVGLVLLSEKSTNVLSSVLVEVVEGAFWL